MKTIRNIAVSAWMAAALLLGLLVITLIQYDFGSAEPVGRPFYTANSDCVSAGGSWNGSSDEIGTCTFPANSGSAINACGNNHIYYVVYDIDFEATGSCVAIEIEYYIPAGEPPPDLSEKCKLIEIDRILNVGGIFNAKWIGVLESIRFRQTGAGLEFITMIPGTLSYAQVHPEHNELHRAGDFSNGFKLDRGRWEATCWGPEGTFGTAFIVFVE